MQHRIQISKLIVLTAITTLASTLAGLCLYEYLQNKTHLLPLIMSWCATIVGMLVTVLQAVKIEKDITAITPIKERTKKIDYDDPYTSGQGAR